MMPLIDEVNRPINDNAANSEPVVADDLGALELLTTVGLHKSFVAKCTIGLSIAALLIAFLITPKYTATTTILPPQQNSSLSTALLSQIGNLGPLASLAGGGLGIKNPNDLYVSMLKSRRVEDAVIRRFDLMKIYREKRISDARKELESNCNIDNGQKDGLIRLSVVDKDPRRAAEIANAFVEEYRNLTGDLAITEASQRRLFFEQQLVQAKNNLAGAEEELKKTQQRTGVIQLDSQARALIESVAVLRAQIAAKEVQIHTLSSFSTSINPELLIAQQELAALRTQLQRLGGSNTQDGDLIVPKGKVPEAGLEYIRRVRDVKYYETIFEMLARQLELAKLDEAKEGAFVQVVDPAVVPDKKSSPPRGLIVVGAFVLGLLGSVFWVLMASAFAQEGSEPGRAQQFDMFRNAWKIKARTSTSHS